VATLTAATTEVVNAAKRELAALLIAPRGGESYALMEAVGTKMLNSCAFEPLLTLLKDEEDAKEASETAKRWLRNNSYKVGDFVRYDDVSEKNGKTQNEDIHNNVRDRRMGGDR
jgi:hypothetical protein